MNAKLQDWNALIASLPQAHFMQTQEWAAIKQQTGWLPHYLTWVTSGGQSRLSPWSAGDTPSGKLCAAVLVLQRTIPIMGFAPRLRLLYCPKGPLLDWENASLRHTVLTDLAQLAKRQGAIFIKIDPDIQLGTGIPGSDTDRPNPAGELIVSELTNLGWLFSAEQVQFRNTVLVDLSVDEAMLLSRMKQKTRYNVRLAERKGVTIRTAGLPDLDLLYRMYAETSLRDGFVIRTPQYYLETWETFIKAGLAEGLIAEVSGEPIAALIIFRFAGQAWYVYGMSRQLHRDKMPNHLLQFEAMRRARAAGCERYDLWGAPDEFIENAPLWGVFQFKQGLGGEVVRHLGAWDLPVRPIFYKLYTQILPRLLEGMRRRGRAAIRRIHEN